MARWSNTPAEGRAQACTGIIVSRQRLWNHCVMFVPSAQGHFCVGLPHPNYRLFGASWHRVHALDASSRLSQAVPPWLHLLLPFALHPLLLVFSIASVWL